MHLCFCLVVGLWCSTGPHSGHSWRGDCTQGSGSCLRSGGGLVACADGGLVYLLYSPLTQSLPGVYSAGEFVGWYNGVPELKDVSTGTDRTHITRHAHRESLWDEWSIPHTYVCSGLTIGCVCLPVSLLSVCLPVSLSVCLSVCLSFVPRAVYRYRAMHDSTPNKIPGNCVR